VQKFSRFRRSSDLHARVVDYVPFTATSVEEQYKGIYLFPKRHAGTLETKGVMSRDGRDSITGTGDRHLGRLQRSVVCRGESPVLRERRNRGVRQISLDYSAEFIEFLLA
jgi:hypothetical protein